MRCLFAVAILLLAYPAGAEPFQEGDWIVVRSRLADCRTWPDRVVLVSQVQRGTAVSLLGLADVIPSELEPAEVDRILREEFERARPEASLPRTHVIRLLRLTPAFVDEASVSLRAIVDGTCPAMPPRPEQNYKLPRREPPPPLGPGDFEVSPEFRALAAAAAGTFGR